MAARFNADKLFIGMETTYKCTKCKKEFMEFWDSYKCKKIVEKPCECGENKKPKEKNKK